MIELIPAIDLKDGRCVRLVQGDMDRETVYYEDPVEAATHWVRQGAPRLHLVDLNGAVSGEPRNREVICRIAQSVPVPVQLGGGIRNPQDIELYLAAGLDRLILGTLACREPEKGRELATAYPGKIVLGLDARDGFLAVQGWSDVTRVRAEDLLHTYAGTPVAAVVYTDIHRDGMLTGPNVESTRKVIASSPFPVIASGGISRSEDIAELSRLESAGLCGAILGKALYSGNLTYADALQSAGAHG